jgi:HEAT repeat protein
VIVWDTTGNVLFPLPVRTPASSLAFSPDGQRLAVGNTAGGVSLWELEHEQEVLTLSGLPGSDPDPLHACIRRLAFSSDGRSLVAATADGTVLVWESGPGEPPERSARLFAQDCRTFRDASRGEKIPLEQVRTLLRSPHLPIRLGGVRLLAEGENVPTVALGLGLLDSSAVVREAARTIARTLRTDAPDSVPLLTAALHDSDTAIRRAAGRVFALLASLDPSGPGLASAVPALAAALHDPSSSVRLFTAQTLRDLGPAAVEARERLLLALRDRDPFVGFTAAQALARIGTTAVAGLRKAVGDADGTVRLFALSALRDMGEQASEAVPELLALLTSSEAEVRRQAVLALRNLLPATPRAKLLLPVLKDPAVEVRREAATALLEVCLPDPLNVSTLVDGLLDPDPEMRSLTVRILGKWGSAARIAGPALAVACFDTCLSVRTQAAVALADLGWDDERTLPALMEALSLVDVPARWRIVAILARLAVRDDSAVDGLIVALQDREPSVRLRAVVALRDLGPRGLPGVPALLEILEESSVVRLAAADALRAMGSPVS